MMTDENFEQFIQALPWQLQGKNARRVIRNMANGGARLRTFMRPDAMPGGISQQLVAIADTLGARPRTLKIRTAAIKPVENSTVP
jgi:predicted ABC-type transport system involved in lysophospholipase L1 biosynthesis ATPase subunit